MKSNKIGKYVHIKKLCNNNNHLEMLAIDQRPPIFNIIFLDRPLALFLISRRIDLWLIKKRF